MAFGWIGIKKIKKKGDLRMEKEQRTKVDGVDISTFVLIFLWEVVGRKGAAAEAVLFYSTTLIRFQTEASVRPLPSLNWVKVTPQFVINKVGIK
jgi:hypothetical protein